MKRTIAFAVYWLGLAFGFGALVQSAVHARWWELPLAPLLAAPIWWIAAGIGVRLGVGPTEFFRSCAVTIGLVDPPPEREPEPQPR